MNYRPTDWDREADRILDAKAAHSAFRGADQEHDALDQAEDREQEKGCSLVQAIAVQSQDPHSRRLAQAAEAWEREKDAAHDAGSRHVDRADGHLGKALDIAEPHRTANQKRTPAKQGATA